jgi:PKD repeat protein
VASSIIIGDYNITLIASDDKGNKSEPKTLKVTVRAASGPVTNNTSVVGYVKIFFKHRCCII